MQVGDIVVLKNTVDENFEPLQRIGWFTRQLCLVVEVCDNLFSCRKLRDDGTDYPDRLIYTGNLQEEYVVIPVDKVPEIVLENIKCKNARDSCLSVRPVSSTYTQQRLNPCEVEAFLFLLETVIQDVKDGKLGISNGNIVRDIRDGVTIQAKFPYIKPKEHKLECTNGSTISVDNAPRLRGVSADRITLDSMAFAEAEKRVTAKYAQDIKDANERAALEMLNEGGDK